MANETPRDDGSVSELIRRLSAATANYGLGSVLPQILGFVLIPVYTRVLSSNDYGIADLTSAVGALLFVVLRLGMGGSITRFYYEQDNERSVSEYISTVLYFLTAWSIGVGLLVTLIGDTVWRVFEPGVAFYPYVVIGIWTAVLGVPADALRRVLQVREMSRQHSILTVSSAFLSLGLTVVFVLFLRMGVIGMLLASLIRAAVVYVVTWILLRKDLVLTIQWQNLRSSLRYGLPMVPHHFFGWLQTLSDRLFLAHYSTLTAVGLYGMGFRIVLPLRILLDAFGLAWSPLYFSQKKKLGDASAAPLGRLTTLALLALLFVAVSTVALARDAIVLLLPERYHASHTVVPALVSATVAMAVLKLIVPALYYAKRTGLAAMASCAAAAANIVFCLMFVPRYGAIGAAWSSCLSSTISLAVAAYCVFRVARPTYEWGRLARLAALCVATLCATTATRWMELSPATNLILRATICLTLYPLGALALRIVSLDEIPFLRKEIKVPARTL